MTDDAYGVPLHRTVDPDDILDFHAARLLVLLEVCGTGTRVRRIDGRTKLAKLDFFLRYPRFLHEAHQSMDLVSASSEDSGAAAELEAPMIRYRYGPWDPSYRDYLAFLESRKLIRVVGSDIEGYSLTGAGRQLARHLMEVPAFRPLVDRASSMVDNLALWNGNQLKLFIYERFAAEVADLTYRETITP
jgi:hypothetical protein